MSITLSMIPSSYGLLIYTFLHSEYKIIVSAKYIHMSLGKKKSCLTIVNFLHLNNYDFSFIYLFIFTHDKVNKLLINFLQI